MYPSGGEILILFLILAANILFWGGLVYLIVKLVRRKPKGAKKCPYCAEWIQPEAIVCRYCKRDLV